MKLKHQSTGSRESSRVSAIDPDRVGFVARLRKLAEIAGSPAALSSAVGIADSTIRTYLNEDGAEPKRSQLVAIARGMNVSIAWLCSGDGPMEGDDASTRLRRALGVDDAILVDAYPMALTGGSPSWEVANSPINKVAVMRTQIAAAQRARVCAVQVVDDAMDPELRLGEFAVIDLGDRELLPGGGVFVFGWEGGLYLRRLLPEPSGALLVRAVNAEYQTFRVVSERREDLIVYGRAFLAARSQQIT
jgi:phage repressor protein C with HTH and peptisase S24 domain